MNNESGVKEPRALRRWRMQPANPSEQISQLHFALKQWLLLMLEKELGYIQNNPIMERIHREQPDACKFKTPKHRTSLIWIV